MTTGFAMVTRTKMPENLAEETEGGNLPVVSAFPIRPMKTVGFSTCAMAFVTRWQIVFFGFVSVKMVAH